MEFLAGTALGRELDAIRNQCIMAHQSMRASPKRAYEGLIYVFLRAGSRPITRQEGPLVMMNSPSRLLVFVLGLTAAVIAADTPEWPQFRGPQCNPVSHGRLPDTWSKTENVEWSAEIPGRGWSSPIVS